MKKVVVVGCGNVGMAYINNLVNTNGLVNEITLIDINRDKILGEAMDLNHASVVFNTNIKIIAGEYKDCFNADIVVIAAGLNQEKGETRLHLIKRNKTIIETIVDEVMASGFNGIFLVATNPVDIMTYIVKEKSGLPVSKVIGTGTLLDTERLKYLLSQKIKINTENIHAYVVGEHGDSSFVVWSKSTVGMVPILNTVSVEDLDAIENEVRQLAYKIISYKDYTSYGVAMCMLKITKAILSDQNLVLNVSSYVDGIYIGMPSVIGKDGVKGTMKINFNEEETEKFEKSKKVIKDAINSLEE
ncbi:MAG: L-lactate dehydrogenase [Bacilli bacterium]|nr:L-lactate dehydrogenase [Bacilli bacterium]